MDSQRETFIVATKQLVDILNRTIDNAKKMFSQATASEGFQPFNLASREQAPKAVPNIGEPTWTAYWEWMKAIGVSSKQEVEELTAKFPKDDKELSKCMDELNAAEARFSELAAMLNAIIQKKEDKVLTFVLIKA